MGVRLLGNDVYKFLNQRTWVTEDQFGNPYQPGVIGAARTELGKMREESHFQCPEHSRFKDRLRPSLFSVLTEA